MIFVLAIAIFGAILEVYWLVTLAAIIWTIAYCIAFINGVTNFFNPGVPRMGTLICGVKAALGIYILIWAFT